MNPARGGRRNLRTGAALLAAGALVAAAQAQPAPLTLQASTREPRAYGYQVGDTLRREVLVTVPAGWQLDEASLPRPGGRGQAIELRALRLAPQAVPGGQRQRLLLDYQVFLAPREVRTLEIAPFSLRYTAPGAAGAVREQALRIDAWPVTVAPLLPLVVSPREGLGELQPDVPPPPIDTAAPRARLQAWALLAAAALAWLAALRWAWPAWQRRHQPFGRAWARLRRLPDTPDADAWRDACRTLHRALDASAGQVVFEAGLAGWVAQRAAWAPLQAELAAFLRRSRQAFFAPDGAVAPADRDGAWLRSLARRCCDAERGDA